MSQEKLFVYMIKADDEVKRAAYRVRNRRYSFKYQIAFPKAVYKAMWNESKKPDSLFYTKGRYLYYTNIYGDRIYVRSLSK